ncbi:MAG: response regulator [Opitutales bacterium]|nr:response regulator [Opitutales bacterium]
MNDLQDDHPRELPGSSSAEMPGNNGCAASGSGHRLIIAEDNQFLREMMAGELRRKGYFVTATEDGEACWEYLFADPYDLIITDNDMPRLKGLDLLQRIRDQPIDIPAILISGSLPKNWSARVKGLAPVKVIEKPFTLAEILVEIQVALANVPGEQPKPHPLPIAVAKHDPPAGMNTSSPVFLSSSRK